jgi:hypothetical protein
VNAPSSTLNWRSAAEAEASTPIADAGLPAEDLLLIVGPMTASMGTSYGDWLVEHGTAALGSPRPPGVRKRRQPASSTSCYMNAANLAMDQEDLTYCEGYVLMAPRDAAARRFISPYASLSQHAWCLSADGTVIDVTYDYPECGAYLGVKLLGGRLAVANTLHTNQAWGPWGPWRPQGLR